MTTNEPKPNDCAIWKSTSNYGNSYLSVQVTIDGVKHKFACFPNDYKTTDMHPDYKSAKPRETAPQQREIPVAQKVTPGQYNKITPVTRPADADDLDLPF